MQQILFTFILVVIGNATTAFAQDPPVDTAPPSKFTSEEISACNKTLDGWGCNKIKASLPDNLKNTIKDCRTQDALGLSKNRPLDELKRAGGCAKGLWTNAKGTILFFTNPIFKKLKNCTDKDRGEMLQQLAFLNNYDQVISGFSGKTCPETENFVQLELAKYRKKLEPKFKARPESLSPEENRFLAMHGVDIKRISDRCIKNEVGMEKVCDIFLAAAGAAAGGTAIYRGLASVGEGVISWARGAKAVATMAGETTATVSASEVTAAAKAVEGQGAKLSRLSADEVEKLATKAQGQAHDKYFGSQIRQPPTSADEIAKTAASDWKPVPGATAAEFDSLGGAQNGFRVRTADSGEKVLEQYKFVPGKMLDPRLNKKMNGLSGDYVKDLVNAGKTGDYSSLGPKVHDRWARQFSWEFGKDQPLGHVVGKGVSKSSVELAGNGNPSKLYAEVTALVKKGKPDWMSQETYVRLSENWQHFDNLPPAAQLKDLQQLINLPTH